MEMQIRAYIESLFRSAYPSQKAVELKEEMIQNLLEKYNGLVAEGKSSEAAYNISVASIGDVSELIDSLNASATIVPPIINGAAPEDDAKKKKSAICITVAVVMYIMCVIPVLIFDNTFGIILMFLMVAGATGILVYNGNVNKKPVYDGDVAADFKQWREETGDKKSIYKAVSTMITALTLVIYFVVSFATGAWYITWLIFVISGALQTVARTIIYELGGTSR